MKKYDPALRSRAWAGLALRAAVAGYLIYLAVKIVSGMMEGGPVPSWGAWGIAAAFAAVAVCFCVYAWKAFRKAWKAAALSEEMAAAGDGGDKDAGVRRDTESPPFK
ncbi:hypothetical protein [Sporobacter termitidis]|nr:hypothetical protein [Sporobacter termitidis]